jgi:hypothetical protein
MVSFCGGRHRRHQARQHLRATEEIERWERGIFGSTRILSSPIATRPTASLINTRHRPSGFIVHLIRRKDRSVHVVDQEEVRLRLGANLFNKSKNLARDRSELDSPLDVNDRTKAFDEVLVAVAWAELDNPNPGRIARR